MKKETTLRENILEELRLGLNLMVWKQMSRVQAPP